MKRSWPCVAPWSSSVEQAEQLRETMQPFWSPAQSKPVCKGSLGSNHLETPQNHSKSLAVWPHWQGWNLTVPWPRATLTKRTRLMCDPPNQPPPGPSRCEHLCRAGLRKTEKDGPNPGAPWHHRWHWGQPRGRPCWSFLLRVLWPGSLSPHWGPFPQFTKTSV